MEKTIPSEIISKMREVKLSVLDTHWLLSADTYLRLLLSSLKTHDEDA